MTKLLADTVSTFTGFPPTVTCPVNVCAPVVFTVAGLGNAIVVALTLSVERGLLLPIAETNVTAPVPALTTRDEGARLVSWTYPVIPDAFVGLRSFH